MNRSEHEARENLLALSSAYQRVASVQPSNAHDAAVLLEQLATAMAANVKTLQSEQA